jgi:hypothetical protein
VVTNQFCEGEADQKFLFVHRYRTPQFATIFAAGATAFGVCLRYNKKPLN